MPGLLVVFHYHMVARYITWLVLTEMADLFSVFGSTPFGGPTSCAHLWWPNSTLVAWGAVSYVAWFVLVLHGLFARLARLALSVLW